jgi:23S rRNA pseudouridine1911/1915/1917 synthase
VPETRSFQVSAETTERLDRFLAEQLSLSRAQAARLVGLGAVTVNDKPGRAGRGLARGDLVTVTFPDAEPPRPVRPLEIDLSVVYEDEWMLVLDKPAGLVVHPAPGHWDDTVVNALAARGTSLSRAVGERPGIVHRLDRDTSGLMVIAKTDTAHRRLAGALQQRKIERVYAALVWGHVGGERTIDEAVARHPRDRKRMAVLATGRPARTRVATVARFELTDVVRVTLETGRTHQIRVHLLHVGHPVVGDPVYGGGGYRRASASLRQAARTLEEAAPRQALHAAALRLAHPETREWMEFHAPWPADLKRCLALASGDPSLVDRPSVLQYLGFFK